MINMVHPYLHEIKILMGRWILESSVEFVFLTLPHGITRIGPPASVSFDGSFLNLMNFLFESISITMFCFLELFVFWLTGVVLIFSVWFVFVVKSVGGVCWLAKTSMCLGGWFVSIRVFSSFCFICCPFVRLHLFCFQLLLYESIVHWIINFVTVICNLDFVFCNFVFLRCEIKN